MPQPYLEVLENTLTRVFPKLNVGRFTRKPISVDELAKRIKEELEQSS
jgi:hypothetical protein